MSAILKIDLSKIGDTELESLGRLAIKCEEEFQEEYCELEEFFRQLGDILNAERVLRRSGMAAEGVQAFELLDPLLFGPGAVLTLVRLFVEWSYSKDGRGYLGLALMRAFGIIPA